MLANQFEADNLWYAEKALVIKYSLNVSLTFFQLFSPNLKVLKLSYYSF